MNATGGKSNIVSFLSLRFALGSLCLLLLLAPALAHAGRSTSSALAYLALAPLCHQNPARSFTLAGFPWGACQRCSGIYFGLLLATFLSGACCRHLADPQRRRIWVASATLPMMVDVALGALPASMSVPWSRFATGFVFGGMLTTLLVPALAELTTEMRESRAVRLRC